MLKGNLQPDILIHHGGETKYLDIAYVANDEKMEQVFSFKNGRYDKAGPIIPVIIRYNGTIYHKSLELLKKLKLSDYIWSSMYKHIYNAISKNWIYAERNCLHQIEVRMENDAMKQKLVQDKDEAYADVIKKEEGWKPNSAEIEGGDKTIWNDESEYENDQQMY